MTPGRPGRFTSPLLPFKQGPSGVSVAHGCGLAPRSQQWVLLCAVAQGGYSPGDEIPVANTSIQDQDFNAFGACANASQVTLTTVSGATQALYKNQSSAGFFTLTEANWRLKCYADW